MGKEDAQQYSAHLPAVSQLCDGHPRRLARSLPDASWCAVVEAGWCSQLYAGGVRVILEVLCGSECASLTLPERLCAGRRG